MELTYLKTSRRRAWIARAAVVAVFLFFFIYTWGHWGDLRVDTGHEMSRTAALAQGRALYQEIWYQYPPLAIQAVAVTFRIFGIHLNTLYALGMALTLGSALIWLEVSRRFLPPFAAFVVVLAFLLQAFSPDEFNYILPYTHAALFGFFFSSVSLYFLVRHECHEVGPNLAISGLAAGCAALSKQEYGGACGLVLLLAVAAGFLSHRSWRTLCRQCLACLPGALLVAAVYGWMFWRFSAKFILMENFQVAPSAYFMRLYGAKWVADHGLRFIPAEILATMGMAAISLLIWVVLAWLRRQPAIDRWFLPVIITSGLVLGGGYLAHAGWARRIVSLRFRTEFLFFPVGMYWLACGLVAYQMIEFIRSRWHPRRLPWLVIGAYGLVAGLRVMVQVEPRNYSIFCSPSLFLIFIIIVNGVAARALRLAGVANWRRSVNGLMILEALALGVLLWPAPHYYPSRLATRFGTIYTRPAEARVFPQVIRFVESQKELGKRVLMLPEEASLYFFCGTEAPTRFTNLMPGMLLPEHEDEYLAEVEAAGIDYVLLSNRNTEEYGVPYFGLDYHQKVYRWIRDNYEVVGEFGKFARTRQSPYAMLIYKRRGEKGPFAGP